MVEVQAQSPKCCTLERELISLALPPASLSLEGSEPCSPPPPHLLCWLARYWATVYTVSSQMGYWCRLQLLPHPGEKGNLIKAKILVSELPLWIFPYQPSSPYPQPIPLFF